MKQHSKEAQLLNLGSKMPYEMQEMERNSLKISVWCVPSYDTVIGHFFILRVCGQKHLPEHVANLRNITNVAFKSHCCFPKRWALPYWDTMFEYFWLQHSLINRKNAGVYCLATKIARMAIH